jgi:hypothetical protein
MVKQTGAVAVLLAQNLEQLILVVEQTIVEILIMKAVTIQ